MNSSRPYRSQPTSTPQPPSGFLEAMEAKPIHTFEELRRQSPSGCLYPSCPCDAEHLCPEDVRRRWMVEDRYPEPTRGGNVMVWVLLAIALVLATAVSLGVWGILTYARLRGW